MLSRNQSRFFSVRMHTTNANDNEGGWEERGFRGKGSGEMFPGGVTWEMIGCGLRNRCCLLCWKGHTNAGNSFIRHQRVARLLEFLGFPGAAGLWAGLGVTVQGLDDSHVPCMSITCLHSPPLASTRLLHSPPPLTSSTHLHYSPPLTSTSSPLAFFRGIAPLSDSFLK